MWVAIKDNDKKKLTGIKNVSLMLWDNSYIYCS